MTTETYDKKPKFDPNKPFEPVEEKPKFDPNKPFEAVDETVKKKEDSPFSFQRQLPRSSGLSAKQSGLEAPFSSVGKKMAERENYAAKYEEAQSAVSNVEKYPGTLMYDMNIDAAGKQGGDYITLKREQTSLPHVAGISLGGNINVDRKKYIEEQKALRDSIVAKNNELKTNAAKALEGVRGNISRNIEEITDNLDEFTTASAEGDKIPDVNKINDFARKKAEEKGLSDEGYYKNLLYNEAKANVAHKIIEPKVIERLNENYKNKYGKSIDEETTQEALKGFTKDEEIISKAKVQAKSVQDIIAKEAKDEVDALNNAVTQESEVIKSQYQQLAQSVQTQEQADELYKTTLASINKLNEDFLKQQNIINSKYNARYRRQVAEITKIADAKIKEEGEKYKYKRSPDFQKRIEAEYKEAYNQILKEKGESLEKRDKMYNPALNFGRTFLTSLGGAIKGISSSMDFDTGKVFGDYLSEQYQHGATQIKEFKDLLDITKLSKSMGSLGGGMTPALIAAGATTLATGGAGAPAGVSMLAGGFASWAAETAQMSGQMYEDKFAETGSAFAAENAAKQTLDSQVLLMPLYAFDGLPFMGKAVKLGKNVPTRILLGGTIEAATEFAQEYPQNLFEEAIRNDQDYMEGLKLSSLERAKDTFLNIAPTFLLGGSGQAVGAISEARENALAKSAAKAFAIKSDFKNIPINFQDQYVLDILQRKGKNFANAFVGSLFSNGMIDEVQSNKLAETIKLSEETLANASKYGLNPAEQKVYTSLALKRAEALAMAEAETDPVLRMAAMTNVSSIENDMVNIATGNKADYTVVTLPNNEQYVMTVKEAEKAIQDEKFQDAYYNGDIKVETYGKRGVVQETLDELDTQKKKERKDAERSPEQVIIDAANEGHFGFTGEMVKSGQVTPQQAILELAMQKYGVLGDGSVDEKGGRDISMKTSIAVDEAVTQVYPNQKTVVDAVKPTAKDSPMETIAAKQEGTAENVVPSTFEKEDVTNKISELEVERDMSVLKERVPEMKIAKEVIPSVDDVKIASKTSDDLISNKNKRRELTDNYNKLKALIECLTKI